MIWTLHRKLVVGRAGYQRCNQKKEKKTRRRRTKPHPCRSVIFWARRFLGLGYLCLRLSFWSECSDPLLFSQCSAAPTLLFLWAGQGSSLAAFRQGSAAFLYFSGQQASWRCQVGGRHLPTVSYGQSNIQIHSDSGFFRVNGLCTFGPHSFSQHFVKQTFQ